ncbi:4747_t:CDS:2 [Entrophospora sp. SA101]|nr:4747_t:CDS:2 [Entrophospora sp. SA101]
MSAIVTKIVEKYNLSSETSVANLSQYTSEFLENLTDDRKQNQARRRLWEGFKFSNEQRAGKTKNINLVEGNCRITITKPSKSLEEEIIREKAKRILQNRYGFSEDQVEALFSAQENESRFGESLLCRTEGTTLKGYKTVNMCQDTSSATAVSNKPSKGMEEETIGDMVQRILRNKLSMRDVRAEAYALALSAKNANAGSSHLSRLRRELRNLNASLEIIEATKFPDITEDANKIQSDNWKKAKTINYPDEFTLESALADVMVMLCIRPAELTTLCITDSGVTGKPGVKWFNKFLKDYDLIPKYLRKLGAVYGAVLHKAENPAHVYTIAGECLHHNSDNHTSPVQNYVVVNYRKRGVPYEQARPFHIYDQD